MAETNALLGSTDGYVMSSNSGGQPDAVFPFTFEEYQSVLARLHQCYCGKSVADGETLSRCGTCKATYYCSPEHQKLAWNSAPFMHKNFCAKLQTILAGGFEEIERYMVIFSPQNAPNVKLVEALEGWSIICAALERRIFEDEYQEAKLVHWAGTTHAMMCGQLMRETLKNFDLQSLLKFFTPSINFFENVLQIANRSARALELAPFANFELFGLWSSLGLSMKDSDPVKMEFFFSNAASRFGIPAIEGLLELMVSTGSEDDMLMQSVQQWTQSVITILTQRKASFALAEHAVAVVGNYADDSQNIRELHMFASCLYDSAVQAHAMVVEKTGKPDSEWKEEENNAYAQHRQVILQHLMQRAFPELMQQAGQ